jgi:hypothetical protein
MKIHYTDMTEDCSSADYGDDIAAVAMYPNAAFVYCGGATTQVVWKLNVADLTWAASSADFNKDIKCLAVDDTNIFVGTEAAAGAVYKVTIATMATAATSAVTYGWTIRSISIDDTYVYMAAQYTNHVYKLLQSDLTEIAYYDFTDDVYTVVSEGGYLYIGGTLAIGQVHKVANRVLWQRSDHEITITSAGTAKCGLDFASTASQANYWKQTYENQTSGKEFDWEGTQANGKVLDVDSALWYVTNDGATAMSGVSGEFLTLSPGANVLYLENVTGTVVFGWTDRFA